VLIKFKGELLPGITLRDLVNAIPLFAIKKGLLTVEKANKKNIFNGKIMEIEGLPNLKLEQAFELLMLLQNAHALVAQYFYPKKLFKNI